MSDPSVITNTAPIVNTPVANTNAILGDIDNSSALAAGKNDEKGKDLLLLKYVPLAQKLWPLLFPDNRNVAIRELSRNSGPSVIVRNFDWAGWTNSAGEVWIRDQGIEDGEERVASVCSVLCHEQVHVVQFQKNKGGRPKSLEQMLGFEREAYPAGLSWIHHKSQAALEALFNPVTKAGILGLLLEIYEGMWDAVFDIQDMLDQATKDRNAGMTPAQIYEKVRIAMVGKGLMPDLPSMTEEVLLKALYGY